MKHKITTLFLTLLFAASNIFASENDGKNGGVTENLEFGLSKTTYTPATVPSSDATGAPYNSLNVEIGLSKLRIFGYEQTTYYYIRILLWILVYYNRTITYFQNI